MSSGLCWTPRNVVPFAIGWTHSPGYASASLSATHSFSTPRRTASLSTWRPPESTLRLETRVIRWFAGPSIRTKRWWHVRGAKTDYMSALARRRPTRRAVSPSDRRATGAATTDPVGQPWFYSGQLRWPLVDVPTIQRTEAGWRLPLDGAEVSQLQIDHALSIVFSRGSFWAQLRIGGSFDLVWSDHRSSYAAQASRASWGPVLDLFKAQVSTGLTDATGNLTVMFADGRSLWVPVDEAYEAWEVVTSNRARAVCMAGGELAVWDGETVI